MFRGLSSDTADPRLAGLFRTDRQQRRLLLRMQSVYEGALCRWPHKQFNRGKRSRRRRGRRRKIYTFTKLSFHDPLIRGNIFIVCEHTPPQSCSLLAHIGKLFYQKIFATILPCCYRCCCSRHLAVALPVGHRFLQRMYSNRIQGVLSFVWG